MTDKRTKPNHQLTELTKLAVDNVYEATKLSINGYANEVRDELATHDAWTRGWFAEGIGQGLYLHDLREANDFEHLRSFLNDEQESDSVVAAYVGMGLAIAHTDQFSETLYADLNEESRSWVFDGIGFYNMIMAGELDASSVELPDYLAENAERTSAFYAGVGRAIWFAIGEYDLNRVDNIVDSFPAEAKAGIWRGVGFASTYAGGSQTSLRILKARAGDHAHHLQAGCAIAIVLQGSDEVAHREVAAQVYLGKSIAETIQLMPSANLEDVSDALLHLDQALDKA